MANLYIGAPITNNAHCAGTRETKWLAERRQMALRPACLGEYTNEEQKKKSKTEERKLDIDESAVLVYAKKKWAR